MGRIIGTTTGSQIRIEICRSLPSTFEIQKHKTETKRNRFTYDFFKPEVIFLKPEVDLLKPEVDFLKLEVIY